MTNEMWAVIEIDDRYSVSNAGRVRGPRGPMRPVKFNTGYVGVNVGKRGIFLVHRLVAMAFVAGHNSRRNMVNHKDGYKLNNLWTNLEWCTAAENIAHAEKFLGKRPIHSVRGSGNKKLSREQMLEIRRRYPAESSKALAAEFGLHRTSIVNIASRRTWAAE